MNSKIYLEFKSVYVCCKKAILHQYNIYNANSKHIVTFANYNMGRLPPIVYNYSSVLGKSTKNKNNESLYLFFLDSAKDDV